MIKEGVKMLKSALLIRLCNSVRLSKKSVELLVKGSPQSVLCRRPVEERALPSLELHLYDHGTQRAPPSAGYTDKSMSALHDVSRPSPRSDVKVVRILRAIACRILLTYRKGKETPDQTLWEASSA
jgi:hypothetical protein